MCFRMRNSSHVKCLDYTFLALQFMTNILFFIRMQCIYLLFFFICSLHIRFLIALEPFAITIVFLGAKQMCIIYIDVISNSRPEGKPMVENSNKNQISFLQTQVILPNHVNFLFVIFSLLRVCFGLIVDHKFLAFARAHMRNMCVPRVHFQVIRLETLSKVTAFI